MYQSNTIRQCLWLITTIRQNERLTLKALQEKWTADKMGDTLYRSTFNRYRDKIYELFGLMMECDEKYQYYFSNPGELADHSIESWLLSTMTANYLRTLPLHHSQRVADVTDDYTDFTLDIRPTPDFIGELLKYDRGLEVLSPPELRLKICKTLEEMLNRY